MTYEEFRTKCDELELTNYQVAEMSGVSKATLSQWKNGNTKPSSKTIKRLEFFIENYDPKGPDFRVVEKDIKERGRIMNETHIYAKNLWIDSLTVMLNNGKPVLLTDKQVYELRKNMEIYANAWLTANKVIGPEEL